MRVTIADGTVMELDTVGRLRLQGEQGRVLTVSEVYYSRDLAMPLLSVSRLVGAGCTVEFTADCALIRAGQGQLLVRAERAGKLYAVRDASQARA